jgi:metal-dependent amidase/aminoacylase/carboxypeptidase family protein
MNLIDRIVQFQSDIARIRRDIHAHPELRFEEVRTADVVAGKLASGATRSTADSRRPASSAR